MTREEAIRFADSGAWKFMTPYDRVALQLFTEHLCMPFDEFHKAIECVLRRSVFTHEFTNTEQLKTEFFDVVHGMRYPQSAGRFMRIKGENTCN